MWRTIKIFYKKKKNTIYLIVPQLGAFDIFAHHFLFYRYLFTFLTHENPNFKLLWCANSYLNAWDAIDIVVASFKSSSCLWFKSRRRQSIGSPIFLFGNCEETMELKIQRMSDLKVFDLRDRHLLLQEIIWFGWPKEFL